MLDRLPLPAVLALGAGVAIAIAWKSGALAAGAAKLGQAVNPLNHENVFHQGANAIARALTGDAGATTGTALFEWMNAGTVAREHEAIYGKPGVSNDAPDTSAWDRLLAGEHGVL